MTVPILDGTTDPPPGNTPVSNPRRLTFDLITAGVAAGLPVPYRVQIPNDHRIVTVFVGNDDLAAAGRWAVWLGLPAPRMSGHPLQSASRWFDSYESETWDHPDLPDWRVQVCSFITVPDPTRRPEVAR